MSDNEIRKALLGLCKGLDAVGQTVIKQAKDIKKIKIEKHHINSCSKRYCGCWLQGF